MSTKEHLFQLENQVEDCRAKMSNEEKNLCPEVVCVRTKQYNSFLEFLLDQQNGVYIGSSITLVLYIADRLFASYWAKKNNIKQKTVMKILFPTIICFICILLRQRKKNSRLAAFLSALKYSTKQESIHMSVKSRSKQRNGSSSSMNPRPKPFLSNAVKPATSDSIFAITAIKRSGSRVTGHVRSSRSTSVPDNFPEIVIKP